MAGEQSTKIIGVVADVRRDAENDYACDKCCIFGLSEEEYSALSAVALITPKRFSFEHCDRVQVRCSPWRAMRILGKNLILINKINGILFKILNIF